MNQQIRVRVCMIIREGDKILLVPHYNTDAGPVQWTLPGGMVEYGEAIREAAEREFEEETGFNVRVGEMVGLYEHILPERPWHSITIGFIGEIVGGTLRSEPDHPYGDKTPKWWPICELVDIQTHPLPLIKKALGLS